MVTAGDPHPDRRALIERIAAANAAGAAAHARVLAAQDPTWGTDVFELAGGVAVLCGPGLYVNRAIGIGLGGFSVSPDDLAELERRSAAVGVPASIDVVPTNDSRLLALAAERGYALARDAHVPRACGAAGRSRGVLTRPGDRGPPRRRRAARYLAGGECRRLRRRRRRSGDAPATRSERPPPPSTASLLVLAADADDGRPLGCANVHIVGGLAILGGMSTLPAERRRGVQAALIAHRVAIAADAGCDLAVSSTLPANASERNLTRAGFRPVFEMATITRHPG